jgi:hypothetical protein
MTTNDFDYKLDVLTAAAEAGDAVAAKDWLNHCALLDAIVDEPNDNLQKAVQALSDAGMLFNSNTDEPFYLPEGADIQLPKKSITLTEEEMNDLINEIGLGGFEPQESDLLDTTGIEDAENFYNFEKAQEWARTIIESKPTEVCPHGEDHWSQCPVCFTIEDERLSN